MKRKLLAVILTLAVFAGSSGSVFAVDNLQELGPDESVGEETTIDIETDEAFEIVSDNSSEGETAPEESDIEVESIMPDKSELPLDEMWDNFTNSREGEDYVPGEVVCMASSEAEAQAVAEIYGGVLKSFNYGVATIDISDSQQSVESAFKMALDTSLDLPLVEPNYIIPIEDTEAEIVYEDVPQQQRSSPWSQQYYENGHNDPSLNPTNSNFQWYHDVIGTYGAWGVTLGRPEVIVAIIDSGTNYEHVELKSKIVDVSEDIDFNNNHNMDQVGHGTHVAGIVGAAVDNEKGGAGVAPGVSIMPINVNGSGGSPNVDYVTAAFQYVAGAVEQENGTVYLGDRRADIVNISIGITRYMAVMEKAISNAYENGVTVVASMGNHSANFVSYPAHYDHVIAVEATDQSGEVSDFSTVGNWADIKAPGVDIYSSYWDKQHSGSNTVFTSLSGTSMAAPVVAGTCALYMSARGHVDPDSMERILKENAVNGIVNISRMLDKDATPPDIGIYANDATEEKDATFLGMVSDGEEYTLTCKVSMDSILTFGAGTYSNNRIIYTTDGKKPSFVEGEIINGTEYDGKGIPISDICLGITNPTKVTVKALTISGFGVTSKISTLKFTVDPDMGEGAVDESLETDFAISIINPPKQIVAGKSITLKAEVLPASVNVKTKWKILSYRNGDLSGAKMTSGGKLTTKAGQSGVITVGCYTADERFYESVDIEVIGSVKAVKKLVIPSSVSLELNPREADGGLDETTIEISKLTDADGVNLLDLDIVSFAWTTSNPAVVTVSTDSINDTYAILTARGAGTAKIICKALDGSNKTAVCSVKVSSIEKIVNKIQVFPEKESDKYDLSINNNGSIKNVTLYSTEPEITVVSVQGDSEGALSQVADPYWSVSNNKVLQVIPSGKSAVIRGLSKGSANVTCKALDGSGKKFTFKVNVKKIVSEITIKGQAYIYPGASGTYMAEAFPADASNKKVNWSVADPKDGSPISGVSISSSGKLSVSKNVTPGTQLLITAIAKDKGQVKATYLAEVLNKTSSISFSPDKKVADLYLGITEAAEAGCSSSMQLTAKASNYADLVFSSSNPKVATLSDYVFDAKTGANVVTVNAHAKGNTTITAKAKDGSGKKATIKIRVNQLVTGINISGQDYIIRGKKATYKATSVEKDASIKTFSWSLVENASGITVNARTGRVSVTEEATVGVYHLRATAADKSGVTAEKAFGVTSKKATGVGIFTNDPASERSVYKVVRDSVNGKLVSMQLFDVDIDGSIEDDERCLGLEAAIAGSEAETVEWSSSNPKVATVSADGYVSAVSKGSAVITATVKDGSKKKDSFKLNVITPAAGVELTIADRQIAKIGYGKKAKVKATLVETYGQPSVKSIDYDYNIVAITMDGYENFDDEISAELKEKKAFFSFSNGVITAQSKTEFNENKEKYRDYLSQKSGTGFGIEVCAYTKDGTGDYAARLFTAVDPTTSLELYTYGISSGDNVRVTDDTIGISAYSKSGTKTYSGLDYSYYRYQIRSDGIYSFNVTSSNPQVASAYCNSNNNSIFYVYPNKPGTTVITIKPKEGSEETLTVKFTVIE